jgi:hypothetical protein
MANAGSLYVFLHGLTVISEAGKPGFEFEIVLPRIHDHVYRAGNWLQESDIALGSTLRLVGLKGGTLRLSGSNVALPLSGVSLQPPSPARAVTLLMPRPKTGLGLLRAKMPNLVTTSAGTPVADEVATAQLLVYDFDDENSLALEGAQKSDHSHEWEPHSIGGAVSLHIVSTSPGPVGEEHELQTERMLAKVIKNYPGLKFADRPPVPSWDTIANADLQPDFKLYSSSAAGASRLSDCVVTSNNNFAFLQEEFEDYPSRMVRLDRLGRMKQLSRSLDGLFVEPDTLGEQMTSCFGVEG